MRRNASFVFLIYSGLSELLRTLYFTVAPLYYISTVGLNPLQLVLVGTTLMIAIMISEVPTGVVADTYSRRLSVIIGSVLMGMAFIVEGLIARFAVVLAAQLCMGVGFTFTSGALQAWIADEREGRDLESVYLRGAQASNLGGLIGIAASVGLATFGLALPMVVAGAGLLALAAWLALAMPERGFQPLPQVERGNWRSLVQTARAGMGVVRVQRALLGVFLITFFFGAASETIDRLWQVQFLDTIGLPALGLAPIAWFGAIKAGGLLLGIAAGEFVQRRIGAGGRIVPALAAISAGIMAAMIVFGLATTFVPGLLAFWAVALLRNVYEPLYLAWVNGHTTSQVRATVLSLASQVDAVGQIAGGPLLGALALGISLPSAFVAAGLLLLPALVVYGVVLGRERAAVPNAEAA
jgi:MFS transporter, DHA3 family, tetracycline resistance protein